MLWTSFSETVVKYFCNQFYGLKYKFGKQSSLRGLTAKVLHCDLIISDFELKSRLLRSLLR